MIVGGQEYIVGAYVFAYACLLGYGLNLRLRVRRQAAAVAATAAEKDAAGAAIFADATAVDSCAAKTSRAQP